MLEQFTTQKKEIINNIDKILHTLNSLNNKLMEINDTDNNLNILNDKFQQLREKINKEKITISAMAIISNGKSTFLNALIFGQPVLQAQSGETTATLFEIKYGEKYKYRRL
jgi:peptidoglycan hydrolase CwlO-like protein